MGRIFSVFDPRAASAGGTAGARPARRAADGVALVLTVLFVMDATHSIQSALDMKETMKQLAGSSQRLERMEEKLDLGRRAPG